MNLKRVTERLQKRQRLDARRQVVPEYSSSWDKRKERLRRRAKRQLNTFSFPQFILRHTNSDGLWNGRSQEWRPLSMISKTNTTHESRRPHAKVGHLTLANTSHENICFELDPLACKTARATRTCSFSSRRPSPFEQLAQTAEHYSKIGLTMDM